MADDAGALLVRAGLIADDQLQAARRAQVSNGGTLGEQLVRLGYIDDDALTHFYRTRLLVPRVDPTRLQDIPNHVLAKLSADVAGEFRVVPVQLDQTGNLVIAMSDPSNTHAVDEISFFTDSYVVRAVASQREIAGALARYYSIETPLHVSNPENAVPAGDAAHDSQPASPDGGARPQPVPEQEPSVRHEVPDRATPPSSPAAARSVQGQRPAGQPMVHSEPEYEPDTRPIMRADELQQLMRRSDEPPIAVSGEVEVSHEDRDLSSKLPAVVIDDDALTPPPGAPPEEQPARTETATRPGVVVTSNASRPPRRTRLGVGSTADAMHAVDEGLSTNAHKYRYSSLIPTVSVDDGWEDDGFGPPGSTIPPFLQGPVPDGLEGSAPPNGSPAQNLHDTREAFDASAARLEQALFYISVADSRDGVINGLVETLGSWCERAAFFAVSQGQLRRWKAQGPGIVADPPASAALCLDKPSTFQDIVATRLPVRGPLHDPASRDFLDATLGVQPDDMLALPITVKNKVVGILYGDVRRVVVYDEHLNALIRAGGEALERIIRERRKG